MAQTAKQKAAAAAAKVTEALTDGLKAAGVALTGSETPEEIRALADKNGVKVLTPEDAKDAAKSGDSITIRYRDHLGSEASRTFSKEIHGEDFAKLADEFKASNASKIIA